MLVSLPTGTGKTVVLASLPHYVLPKKDDCTVVLVNRDELVGQTLQKIQAVSPGAYSATEKGAMRAKGDEEYIVASVYTLHERRIDEFFDRMKGRVGLLIADEAHHAAAFQYRRIFDKFFKERPEGIVVGVTATPQRGDGIGLGSAFDETVYHKDMRWAIQDGWLVPVKCFNVQTNTNLDDIETRMGDFAPEQLAKAVDVDDRNNIAVSAYLEHAKGRKGIVFAPTLAHAKHINETFNGRGVKSEWANGTFKTAERDRIVNNFRHGDLEMLVNVMLWCLDEETEILTRDGWRASTTMTRDDLVAGWTDGEITFARPKNVIVRERRSSERMVTLETRYRSIRVTENHRMIHRSATVSPWQKSPANEIVAKKLNLPISGISKPQDFKIRQPDKITASEFARRVSASSYHYQKNDSTMTIEKSKTHATEELESQSLLRRKNPHDLTEDECRFIGLWVGDGDKVKTSSKRVEYTIHSTNAKPKILKRVREIIKKCGSNFVEHITRNVNENLEHIFSLPRDAEFGKNQRAGLFAIEPYLEKAGTELLWGLDERQFEAFLDGLWKADGNHGDGEPIQNGLGFRITCGNKRLCDLIQAIATCRGYRTTMRRLSESEANVELMHRSLSDLNDAVIARGFTPFWTISFRKEAEYQCSLHDDGASALAFETEPWRPEKVWCVETQTGTVITRRNGTVTVMGNCEGFDVPDVEVMIGIRPTQSRALFVQMLGRILRPDVTTAGLISRDGLSASDRTTIIANSVKPSALLLDLVDQTRRHGLVTLPTLWGLPPKMEMKGEDVEKLKEAVEELEKIDPVTAAEVTSLEHIRTSIAEVSAFAPPIVDEKISAISSLAWRSGGDADDFTLDLPERHIAYDKDGRVIKDFSRIYRECQVSAKNANLKFEDHLQERAPHNPELVRIAQDSVRIRKVDDTYQAEYSWDGETRVLGHEKNVARAFGRTERWIENNRNDILSALSARAPWRAQRATQKQLERLRGMGVPIHLIPDTRGEADMLIKKLIDERKKDSEGTTRNEAVG